jgi:hypothetical protein
VSIIYSRFSSLPHSIRSFVGLHGWIVGGGARYLLGLEKEEPRDWDILIPLEYWDQACKLVPRGSKTNSFGGIKLNTDGLEIDLWGDSLSHFITTQNTWPNYAVNLKTFASITMNNSVKY